ncbi:MAG: DUF1080 domain-containing protein [Candidatus Hydrogenedentes bacterium]|nr:DUF1080 domain-containing protein [Candidatus Hydrogenedentota bacterium]
MRITFKVFAIVVLSFAAWAREPTGPDWAPKLLGYDEAAEGFYPLFNGTDLDGWWIRGENKGAFAVEDDRLVVTGAGGGDWIFSDQEYENFVLRYEYRSLSGIGNSGVGIRATKEGNPAYTGMEIQVIKDGWETPWQRAGALYATVPPAVQADKPMGEWNSVEVLCDGPRIRTAMNGQELYDIRISDYTEDQDWRKKLVDRAKIGHIALQDYSNHVEFRRIRIKPLPGGEGWRPLFNGTDLTGWEAVGDSKWHVREGGILQVLNAGMTQRSALKTTETFDDFELRLSIRPHDRANSGVFFRCSGEDAWPRSYEAQVDNHDPENYTGAIFGQKNASELRALDNCWFQMLIRAEGPHIQVGVNGKVVTNYESPKHDQWRSGWICLQGHDKNSIVDFRDIEIRAAGK